MDSSTPPNETAGENAYRKIRSDIIFGRLAPGQKLKLERLRGRYDTSVSTLREILYRLLSEGFILAEGQRGFEVPPLSAANLREVADMRDLLERHALRDSFAAGDIDWEGRVVAAHHKLARMERRMLAGERSETELWKRYDWEFHHALISACGSKALLETHAVIFDRYVRYQIIAVVFRGKAAADEHEELLDCALRRDAVRAGEILQRHIAACVDYTVGNGLLN
ncbi:FCD domain-containing protein [Aquamicrobium sp. LC103]|uniref:GntR family transcriptional regulator n=1 Tax=Aquamicrobium sp. LC103 TaxID=1120658 RepID=UPI00063EA27B|nr:FCD domain-containing protein [Aquamicrobium sp. LC103]TKT74749.1 FCD domain-containing protein [Aquamicrobium sp. LC103]